MYKGHARARAPPGSTPFRLPPTTQLAHARLVSRPQPRGSQSRHPPASRLASDTDPDQIGLSPRRLLTALFDFFRCESQREKGANHGAKCNPNSPANTRSLRRLLAFLEPRRGPPWATVPLTAPPSSPHAHTCPSLNDRVLTFTSILPFVSFLSRQPRCRSCRSPS